jgi:hypothetical protein
MKKDHPLILVDLMGDRFVQLVIHPNKDSITKWNRPVDVVNLDSEQVNCRAEYSQT